MTFYWWSHWFWITTLSTILLSITTIVHTYPSQEISLEYNQNSKSIKAITKLHQTTTPLEWSTTTTATTTTPVTTTTVSTPTSTTTESLKEKEPAVVDDAGQQQSSEGEGSVENVSKELAAEDEEDALDASGAEPDDPELELDAAVEEENVVEADNAANAEQLEYKRSAEIINKTIDEDHEEGDEMVEEPRVEAVMIQPRSASIDEGVSKLNRDADELSNYTNHSRTPLEARANKTCANCKNATHDFNSTTLERSASISALSAAPKPATRIESPTHSETIEWLNAMAAAAAVPPSKLLTNAPQQRSDIDRGTISVTTESTVVVAAAAAVVGATTMTGQQQQQQRIPFTLENANKEEELRRAENEHRSRKSKVLSAEYKHINRFINYSADTKSLLTRSAATARNDFDGGEENNISSEALSIQRTYFMDASAISAICFTIFGVCCTVGTVGIVLYRRRYLNKPQALSEPDSSVYIDDSTMRDNSDEMYSLDNDSFLNSLEAMTIQNYWTDTVKHTKL